MRRAGFRVGISDMVKPRKAERMPAGPGVAVAFAGRVVEDLGAAKVRDVSMAGIKLVLGSAAAPGSLLAVGLSNSVRDFSKTVLIRVTHAEPVPGGWLVGGTFAE